MATMSRRNLGREGVVLIALVMALGPLSAGCIGLFRPATAQSPDQSGGTNIILDYSDPAATLETMALGIAAKGLGNGKAAYIGALADSMVDNGISFYATFDPQVSAQYPGGVPTWNLSLEKNFYSEFVVLRTDGYLLRWSDADAPGDEIDLLAGEAELYRKYVVFTVTEDGETLDRLAIGIAHLFYKRIGTRWAIVLWEDQVDPAADPDDPDDLSMGKRRLGN
jgi:hypothetical protein